MAYHYAITNKYGPQPLLLKRAYRVLAKEWTQKKHSFEDYDLIIKIHGQQ